MVGIYTSLNVKNENVKPFGNSEKPSNVPVWQTRGKSHVINGSTPRSPGLLPSAWSRYRIQRRMESHRRRKKPPSFTASRASTGSSAATWSPTSTFKVPTC